MSSQLKTSFVNKIFTSSTVTTTKITNVNVSSGTSGVNVNKASNTKEEFEYNAPSVQIEEIEESDQDF